MNVYPLSFSRMQTFEQCALRFDYQYVTRSHKDAGSDASRFGNRVHEAFELYSKGEAAGLPHEMQAFQPILDRLREMPGEHFYELEFAVRRDKSVCEWEDPDCYMRGIADVAVVDGKRGFAADWKTGKPKEDTQQLKLMAAFMLNQFPELETVATKYIWLYYPNAPSQKIVYTRDMLPDLWAHFDRKAERVENAAVNGVFKATPSGLCPWCPAYDSCSFARRRR